MDRGPATRPEAEQVRAADPVSFTVRTSTSDQDTGNTAGNVSDDGQSSGDTDDEGDEAGDTGAAAQDEDALPKTGAPWPLVAVAGLVLVAMGTAFVLLGRRRVTSSARQ